MRPENVHFGQGGPAAAGLGPRFRATGQINSYSKTCDGGGDMGALEWQRRGQREVRRVLKPHLRDCGGFMVLGLSVELGTT